jgi:ABC-2 type transport system ATP-binding protein
VIDQGRVIAEGTADDLKMRVGGEVLAIRVADRSHVGTAAGAVLGLGPGGGNVDNDRGEITLPVGDNGTGVLTEAVRRLDAEKIILADIALRRPSLDDVFLSLTGHAAEETDGDERAEPERVAGRKQR